MVPHVLAGAGKGPMISDELARAIDAFAQHPHVLVACDYDGTLAPIVDNPGHARPIRESIVAMRALAELHATDTAVISGRSLRDLAALSRMPDEVHLVGSHGSEFDVGFESDLSHEVRSHLATLVAALTTMSAMRIVVVLATGQFSLLALKMILLAAPAVLGTSGLLRRYPPRWRRETVLRIVCVLLLATGVSIAASALLGR